MDYGEVSTATKPPIGRRMKPRAPPPPPEPAPRHIFRNAVPDGGGTGGMDIKENVLRPTVEVLLTVPNGYQTALIEDGSKALMDLLVELCSRYHLNPSLHTLELLSPEGHPLGFKPNAPLGSLDVACVLIKEKVWEEKVVRRPAPKVPEKTVRLVVNFHRSQKAVVRVNPLVPLQALVPVICDKCEFDPTHVLLLKDSVSHHELPLDKTLTQLGIKELYVHDQSLDSIHSSTTSVGGSEKKGLLGIFRFNRRKSKTSSETSMDMDATDDNVEQNADTDCNGLSTVSTISCVETRPSTLGQSQSVMNISRMSPKAEPKKRRAPAPPGAPTPSLGHYSEMGLGSESQQRKRKAPVPPATPSVDYYTSTSAGTTPLPDTPSNTPVTETPTPARRTKVLASAATAVALASVVGVTTATAGAAVSPETAAEPPPPATPTPSSPAPSSTTVDSLATLDSSSSSELARSMDDSDSDLDTAAGGSLRGGATSSSSGTLGASVAAVAATTTSGSGSSTPSSWVVEESAVSAIDQSEQEATVAGGSGSETESALNLKMEEVENNRHSAIGPADRPVPPKPRRAPVREPPQLVLPPSLTAPSPVSPPLELTDTGSSPDIPTETEEAATQLYCCGPVRLPRSKRS